MAQLLKRFSVGKCESDKVDQLLDLIDRLLNGLPEGVEIISTAQVTEMRQLSGRITTGNQVQIVYVQYFIFKHPKGVEAYGA